MDKNVVFVCTYTHTHTTEYHAAIKRGCDLAICDNTVGPKIYMLSESGWERKISYEFTHVESKKQNIWIKQKAKSNL